MKPVLNWMFLDDTGRLWVEVQTNQGVRYDIFNPEGRLQATVAGLTPSGGLDPSIAGDRAAFVVEDSATDVQSVRVFRVRPTRIR